MVRGKSRAQQNDERGRSTRSGCARLYQHTYILHVTWFWKVYDRLFSRWWYAGDTGGDSAVAGNRVHQLMVLDVANLIRAAVEAAGRRKAGGVGVVRRQQNNVCGGRSTGFLRRRGGGSLGVALPSPSAKRSPLLDDCSCVGRRLCKGHHQGSERDRSCSKLLGDGRYC